MGQIKEISNWGKYYKFIKNDLFYAVLPRKWKLMETRIRTDARSPKLTRSVYGTYRFKYKYNVKIIINKTSFGICGWPSKHGIRNIEPQISDWNPLEMGRGELYEN